MKKYIFLLIFICFPILGNFLEEFSKQSNISVNHLERIYLEIEKSLKLHESSVPGAWKNYYYVLPELIKKYNFKIGCEVGVAFGGHSLEILTKTDVETLYSIDPYLEYGDSTNSFLFYYAPTNLTSQEKQIYWDILYKIVEIRLSKFGSRSIFLRKTSTDGILDFEDDSLDFCFIDGNHSYEYVKHDLDVWFRKVRPGGIICGDDYNNLQKKGVRKAVDEFSRLHGLKINLVHANRFWYMMKK